MTTNEGTQAKAALISAKRVLRLAIVRALCFGVGSKARLAPLLAQHLQTASDHYKHALEFAEQLKQLDCQHESNLAMFVISLHNIADLALLTGEPEKARRTLTRAFRLLWLQMTQQLAAILLPHLQVCRRELAFFCQNFGSDPVAKALLQLPWPQHLYGH